MNKIIEAHKRKLQDRCSITDAIVGVADELYELRKENRDLQGELKNIAGSLDYVSQYLYDISWELKKNREKNLDLSEQVNQYYNMITLDTPEQIDMFRFLSLKSALKLECLGMSRRGQSAYSIIKAEYGFKGNKKSVLEQMEQIIKEAKND